MTLPPDDVPGLHHHRLAAHSTVKLRLGRLTPQGQKGVDTKLILDLVTLSRQQAINVAIVVSGDEDVREAVEEAQKVGVRVLLVGVQLPTGRSDQAQTLIWESDEHHVLPTEFWSAFLDRAPRSLGEDISASEFGEAFAVGWLQQVSSAESREVITHRPRIPPALDAELMRYACQAAQVAQIDEQDRHLLRQGFWRAIDAGAATAANLGS
jgi:hypothetical protein